MRISQKRTKAETSFKFDEMLAEILRKNALREVPEKFQEYYAGMIARWLWSGGDPIPKPEGYDEWLAKLIAKEKAKRPDLNQIAVWSNKDSFLIDSHFNSTDELRNLADKIDAWVKLHG